MMVVFAFCLDSLVKEKIVSKASIMDVLALHLDRSVCPGKRGAILTQRWEHLADELKVSDDIKRQCETYTGNLSPSEAMFEYQCTNDTLAIGTLKTFLRELGRNDVVTELEKNNNLTGKSSVITKHIANRKGATKRGIFRL